MLCVYTYKHCWVEKKISFGSCAVHFSGNSRSLWYWNQEISLGSVLFCEDPVGGVMFLVCLSDVQVYATSKCVKSWLSTCFLNKRRMAIFILKSFFPAGSNTTKLYFLVCCQQTLPAILAPKSAALFTLYYSTPLLHVNLISNTDIRC